MFVAALMHAHIFGADEWQPDYRPVHLKASVADNLALNDFVKDFRSVLPRRLRRARRAAADSASSSGDDEAKRGPDAVSNPLAAIELREHSAADGDGRALLAASPAASLEEGVP